MKKEKKKSTFGLMGALLINSILYMFLNTFMVAYFITLTNYDYSKISMYYILSFLGILLTFLFFGKIVKNKHQVLVFRSGIFLYCMYILLIAFLKEKIVLYFAPLGFFYGIVQGLFWIAAHVLINEHTKQKTNAFISFKSILEVVLELIFPIIFGTSIEMHSFSVVAKAILPLSFLQFLCSFFIEDQAKTYKKSYNLKEYITYVREKKQFQTVYQLFACDGIVNYLLDTLITILIVITFRSSLSLGILNTIASLCSIVSVYIFGYKWKSNPKILSISSFIFLFSVIFLIFNLNKGTILLYHFSSAIFLVLLRNAGDTKRYEIVNEDLKIEKDYLVEHQVICEVYLNISRILGYFILFIVSLFHQIIFFKLLLAFVTGIVILYAQKLIWLKKKEVVRS